MNTSSQSARPPKRRRTVKGRRGITEGDEITADGIVVRTITSQTAEGSVHEIRSRPVWLQEVNETPQVMEDLPDPVPMDVGPDPDIQMEFVDNADLPNISNTPRTARSQQYYLQEFVKRVEPMLTALLAREVPEKMTCSHCPDGHIARWRCRDCTATLMMCRGCMRETHRSTPLHRIDIWTGTCFRRAQLWQVGTYMLIPHVSGEHFCQALAWNQTLLNEFQLVRDKREQTELMQGWPGPEAGTGDRAAFREPEIIDGPEENPELTEMNDTEFEEHLEHIYAQHRGPTADRPTGGHMMEADDEDGDEEEVPLPVPPDYLPSLARPDGREEPPTRASNMQAHVDTDRPRTDALDNPFIRVVNTNGIHHIAVVSCSCRGQENTHCDLMAARLIPTSFNRYRTMFTHEVLDDFRLDNLECKASAYQYFQKLRRLTSATDPDSVPNLYHELRRMSRVWRWMKKLKWAGSGIGPTPSVQSPSGPGDLANFCPTCPQPGINLPENWKSDPNKCVKSETGVSVR